MQLIYRGQTFNVEATPAATTQTANVLTQTLLYGGHSYVVNLAEPVTRLPRVINWRYSLPCQDIQGILTPAH